MLLAAASKRERERGMPCDDDNVHGDTVSRHKNSNDAKEQSCVGVSTSEDMKEGNDEEGTQQQQQEEEEEEEEEEVRETEETRMCRLLLYKKIRVCLNDGRLVIGTFQCIDSRGNILIANALEVRRRAADDEYGDEMMPGAKAVAPGEWMERYVGLVVVGKHQRQSVKVKATKQEFSSLLANAKEETSLIPGADESSGGGAVPPSSSSPVAISTPSLLCTPPT